MYLIQAGARFPESVSSDAQVGTFTWSNPVNVQDEDTNEANTPFPSGTSPITTHYLKATQFPFSIPSNATITGIMVEVNRRSTEQSASGGSVVDYQVSIMKGGVISATDRSNPEPWPKAISEVHAYGGPTDSWGEEWSPADINDAAGFGVVLSAQINDPNDDQAIIARVEHIRMTVFFSVQS